MPQPVQAMEGKWKREEGFRSNLQNQRPSSERGCNGSALHVQADVGRDEVEGAEDVEGAAEGAAGDAVQAGEVPCYLGVVNGEVGGDGAVEALAGEDLVVFGRFGDGRCGGESVSAVSLCGGQGVECPYRFWKCVPVAMAAGVDSLSAGCWTATVSLLVPSTTPLPLSRYSRRRSDCCIALCASIVLLSRGGVVEWLSWSCRWMWWS